ncbi:MAG: hypothetical protein M0Q91_16345 [Methanoregula sp.]|jgi:hypothetical protein|nr:hypothetical protein [Methanoregula sp.]
MSGNIKNVASPLDAVYEKYKHLDQCLSDTEWCTYGEGAAIYAIAGELWRAVKEARNKPRPPCEECIYQSQSAEHDALIAAQATAAENKRVLDEVYDAMLTSDDIRGDCMRDAIKVIKSLHLAQPEPKEQGLK